jgi:Uma2 family endonuclease
MVVRKPLLKPTDVERMLKCGEIDPDATWELVNGEIVWLSPASNYHSQVCALIIALLVPFAQRIGGRVLTEGAGFMVGPRLQQMRSPDVSLVSRERLHILPRDRVLGTAAPDLAVEVLSPEQHGEAYARPKVGEYLAAGAKVVWLVDPDARTVRVYEPNRDDYAIYSAEAEITLDQIAPGFSAPVRSFLP